VPAPTLRAFVDELITYWDLQYPGELDRSPLPWEGTPGIGERAGSAAGQLFKFPQGVALDAGGTTLYVSDTANHRIIAIDTESFHIEAVIGGSGPGFADGDFGTSRFHRPRGLDTRGDMLYVADSGNFAIRRIDLAEGVVDTIAGTGAQGRGAPPPGTEFPTTAPFELSTPWDVAPGPDGTVHVSMTGVHQIWSWELSADTFGPIAGTGHEGAVSGVSLATAELAQPTGIALADGRLFVADAESSTIREIDFGSDTVARLAGTPERSLFDFGNADGPPGVNRFQHPRGIAVDSEAVYVADTYNHAIRRIDRHTGEVTTVAGGETGGYRDGPIGIASFSEPGALALDGSTLYVADTNNHAVRKINLTAGTVSTVPVLSSDVVTDDRERTEPDRREPRRLAPDADRLVLELQFPEGVGLNGEIPSEYDVTGSMGLDFDQATGAITDSTVEVAMDLRAENTGAPFVRLAATVYFCEKENPTLCFVDHLSIEVPLRVDVHRGDRSVVIEHPVTIPAAFTGLSGDG
ncbi:MAG TPA: hypothetical protein VJ932_05700, partial [Alkalispirochaeta sp.]|nr:hypothetical protein [Alkalispirochaeta sp.]